MRSALRALFIAASLLGSAAWAWPVDLSVAVKADDVHFEKPTAIAWAESADPEVAEVEVLPSGEVLITGKKPGETLALLYAEGRMGVWRVVVQPKDAAGAAKDSDPVSARLEPVKAACPSLEQSSSDALSVGVTTDACRKALLALFQTDAFTSPQVSLTFALEPLQAQLREISQAISPIAQDVQTAYVGAGLRLKGKVTEAQHRKILWAIFRHAIGRVALEDKLEVEKPSRR